MKVPSDVAEIHPAQIVLRNDVEEDERKGRMLKEVSFLNETS
jgi:hypothetical protein